MVIDNVSKYKDKSLEGLKETYNKLILRNINGEKFLISKEFFNAPEIKQDRYIREFINISRELSIVAREIERIAGTGMTVQEIQEGFMEVIK